MFRTLVQDSRELGRWSRVYAERFQIEDVLQAECPDRIRGKASAGVDIECPFDEGHSNAGESDDRACFAVNAGEGTSDWFAVSCRHDSCREFTQLDMLGKMLEDGWFTRDVLTDENFVGIDPNTELKTEAVSTAAQQMAAITYTTSSATDQMRDTARQVMEAVEQVATMSAQSAVSAEQVSAATARQSTSTWEVAQTAQHLTDLSIEVRAEMQKFILDEETRATYLTELGDYPRLRHPLTSKSESAA